MLTHWPADFKHVNQHFGERPRHYQQFNLPGHPGIDIVAPMDAPYYALGDGKVLWISDEIQGQPGVKSANGWQILIDHGSGILAKYCHARPDIPVEVDQEVRGGDVIGRSGNTTALPGQSTGPHLHLELQIEGQGVAGYPNNQVNPWFFLEPLLTQIVRPGEPLVRGWIFKAFSRPDVDGLLVTTARPNFRIRPNSVDDPLGVIRMGTAVIDLGVVENRYVNVEANQFDILLISL